MKIVSISILLNGSRVRIKPVYGGKFRVPDIISKNSLTAKELVEHPALKSMDPVITTDTGEKLRVYQGGDPTQQVVETISLVEKHDLTMKEKHKVSFKKEQSTSIYSSAQLDFPWDDYYGN